MAKNVDLFQYRIQIGNFPNVEFYRVSPYIFPTAKDAREHAAAYLKKYKGKVDVSDKWIHVRKKTRRPSKTPRSIRFAPHLCAPIAHKDGRFPTRANCTSIPERRL